MGLNNEEGRSSFDTSLLQKSNAKIFLFLIKPSGGVCTRI